MLWFHDRWVDRGRADVRTRTGEGAHAWRWRRSSSGSGSAGTSPSRASHPYDTVEWERRDARIPNYKDGTDAFYQPDVEFPIAWSLNATNIVAQKYFRGTLGTPERECVAAPGDRPRRRHDHRRGASRTATSSTTHEAEAFRDELKYILVTQRAAFNSPVWFNIGVKGVPQQASACFILAVDDTMDSILNWYREEGTIFKGGSGSGINLSKHPLVVRAA